MKTTVLLIVAAAIFVGCKNNDKARDAEMRKRFASIDSQFAAYIDSVDSNEQVNVTEQIAAFSNAVMSAKLSEINGGLRSHRKYFALTAILPFCSLRCNGTQ